MTGGAMGQLAIDHEAVVMIAMDLFATMVDGEEGHAAPWFAEPPQIADARHTWVDMRGEHATRVVVSLERAAGDDITRALLGLEPDAPVSDADHADAMGELANVVGGNVKSVIAGGGALTLPVVADHPPERGDAVVEMETWLAWRGRPVGVSIWSLP